LTRKSINYIRQYHRRYGEMNFRQEYGEFSAQEAIDAIQLILRRDGVQIDEKSFTWTVVGVLFDKGIISRHEFEHIYSLIRTEMNGHHKLSGNNA
jgi:hypothetical protein